MSPRLAVLLGLLTVTSCASRRPAVEVRHLRTIEAHAREPEHCVDPMAHAEHVNGLLDDDGRVYYEPTAQHFDLDGDGLPDAVLAADRDASTTRYEIYVRPHGCARYVGGARLSGRIVGTLPKTSHGLAMLEVVDAGASRFGERDGTTTTHRELRFDGVSWVLGALWTSP